jgi:hypothetical protein
VLFTRDELKEQLRKMVHAYRHHHLHAAEMESEEERKHWADQANLACDTLTAMFADRFTTALLRNNETRDVVKTLTRWVRDLRPTHDIDRHAVQESLEDCSELLMRLTSDCGTARGGPAAWPYIKKIRYVVC